MAARIRKHRRLETCHPISELFDGWSKFFRTQAQVEHVSPEIPKGLAKQRYADRDGLFDGRRYADDSGVITWDARSEPLETAL